MNARKVYTYEITDLIPRLTEKTVRKGRNKYRYKSLVVEVYGSKLPDDLKVLLSGVGKKNGTKVRVKAKLVIEVEVDVEKFATEKEFERKVWVVESGIYRGYINYLKADMDHYEVIEIVVRPDNTIKFRKIYSDYGPGALDRIREKFGDIPHLFALPLFRALGEISEYLHRIIEDEKRCPVCGSKLLALAKKGRYSDDYTKINMWHTGYSRDIHEINKYKCVVCDTEYLVEYETWDARSVLNWRIAVVKDGKTYEAAKYGITDDDSLYSYYRGIAKLAQALGILKIVTSDPFEALNNLMPLS